VFELVSGDGASEKEGEGTRAVLRAVHAARFRTVGGPEGHQGKFADQPPPLGVRAGVAPPDQAGGKAPDHRCDEPVVPLVRGEHGSSVVLRQEPDLRSALGLLTRYEHSYNEALRLRLEEDGDLTTLRMWFEFGEPAPTRQPLGLAMAALLAIVRELLGRQWEPLSVCFASAAPTTLNTHWEVFGPRLHFRHAFTGLVFHTAELAAPNTTADPLLRPYTDQFLQALGGPRAATVTDQVRHLVELLLPLGRCSTVQVARSLGITQRTLHRHLALEGTSFSAIVHRTREALAERYLSAERYSLTEVSELLGFSAPSAFSRWFRQQFGMTPSDWRRSQETAASA